MRYSLDLHAHIIKNWLRAKTNIEFLTVWEQMHNPNIKGVEIDTFKSEAGTHYFTMSPQRWIKEISTLYEEAS